MSVKAESISWMLVLPSIQGLRICASTPAASLLSSSPLLISPRTLSTTSPPDSSRNLKQKGGYWLSLQSGAAASPDDSLQDTADGAESPESGDPDVES